MQGIILGNFKKEFLKTLCSYMTAILKVIAGKLNNRHSPKQNLYEVLIACKLVSTCLLKAYINQNQIYLQFMYF